MFVTHCQACGLRELRGARSIELLVNTDHGMVLGYTCTACGSKNVLDGRHRDTHRLQPVPSAA